MKEYPEIKKAEQLLREAEALNPGPWGEHSRTAAYCAQHIAAAAGMDEQKSYVLGLLHDIGRRFGIKHLAHVYDGYRYMLELEYPAIARVCLTHSFCLPDLDVYIGNKDIPPDAERQLREILAEIEYDDYDRLIQLCDCLAGAGEIMDMEARMLDVKQRYGYYPQKKWDANLELKRYFERKTGKDIYRLLKEI